MVILTETSYVQKIKTQLFVTSTLQKIFFAYPSYENGVREDTMSPGPHTVKGHNQGFNSGSLVLLGLEPPTFRSQPKYQKYKVVLLFSFQILKMIFYHSNYSSAVGMVLRCVITFNHAFFNPY